MIKKVRWDILLAQPADIVMVDKFADERLSARGVLRYFRGTKGATEVQRALRARGVNEVRVLAKKAVDRVCRRGASAVSSISSSGFNQPE